MDSDIYARLLYPLGHGCPLWCPEPNGALALDYRETGTRIGDVGILTADGGFDFIFNVCSSAHDPINQFGVPDGFEQLMWNGGVFERSSHFRPNIPLCSRDAKQWEISVSASVLIPGISAGAGPGIAIKFCRDKGAVLMLRNGGDRIDSLDRTVFRNYAARHCSSWYEFVNDKCGREAHNGAIYLVTGFDKADSWENVVVTQSARESSCELKFYAGPGAEAGLKLSVSSQLQRAVSSRCSTESVPHRNQTVFIRGFRVSVQTGLRARLFGPVPVVADTYDLSLPDILDRRPGLDSSSLNGGSATSKSPSSARGSSPSTPSPGDPSSNRTFSESGLLYATSDRQEDNYDSISEERSSDCNFDSDGSNTVIDENEIPQNPRLYHPLTAINNYILMSRRDAQVVITHDHDWLALLNENDFEIPSDLEMISRIHKNFSITVRDGCAFLDPCKDDRAAVEPTDRPIIPQRSYLRSATFPQVRDPSKLPGEEIYRSLRVAGRSFSAAHAITPSHESFIIPDAAMERPKMLSPARRIRTIINTGNRGSFLNDGENGNFSGVTVNYNILRSDTVLQDVGEASSSCKISTAASEVLPSPASSSSRSRRTNFFPFNLW